MMHAYRTEGSYRSAARMTAAELRAAMASREILQSTALAFDTQRQLRFELGGVKAVMCSCISPDGSFYGKQLFPYSFSSPSVDMECLLSVG